jgi:A/G-specific adenine glycosylase
MTSDSPAKKLSGLKFRGKILRWYKKNRRPLPWRRDPTPYRVWISEIMLQQTQAKTVIPFYNRFLRRFPDIRSLAEASEEEVLAYWAGLGYYGRARNILKSARRIVEQYNGVLPGNIKTLLSLPGIGRYTAGAICSIAMHQAHPIVDGNIRRVVARLRGIRRKVPEQYFWDQMSAWLPEKNAAAFNQAMMELGAVICLPSKPLCPRCPVREFCRAKERNLEEKIPLSKRGRSAKKIELSILVVKRRGKILILRQNKSFIPGHWILPFLEVSAGLSPLKTAEKLSRRLGGAGSSAEYCGTVRHSITHHRITAYIYRGTGAQPAAGSGGDAGSVYWADPGQIAARLTSSLFRKALRSLEAR